MKNKKIYLPFLLLITACSDFKSYPSHWTNPRDMRNFIIPYWSGDCPDLTGTYLFPNIIKDKGGSNRPESLIDFKKNGNRSNIQNIDKIKSIEEVESIKDKEKRKSNREKNMHDPQTNFSDFSSSNNFFNLTINNKDRFQNYSDMKIDGPNHTKGPMSNSFSATNNKIVVNLFKKDYDEAECNNIEEENKKNNLGLRQDRDSYSRVFCNGMKKQIVFTYKKHYYCEFGRVKITSTYHDEAWAGSTLRHTTLFKDKIDNLIIQKGVTQKTSLSLNAAVQSIDTGSTNIEYYYRFIRKD